MQREWKIRARSHQCHHHESPFKDGDTVVTVIRWDAGEGDFVRLDFSEDGWQQHQQVVGQDEPPFSVWRSTYEPPPPPEDKSGPVAREGAESLLRRMVEDDLPTTENARYVLALLLERRKLLKQAEAKESEVGRILFYEHVKSGELFLIKDPQLRLDQLEPVQEEVALLIGGKAPAAEAEAATPEQGPDSTAPSGTGAD